MINRILAVGNKIEMIEIAKRNTDEKKVYVSQILEFDEENEDILKIAMPILEGKLIPLQVGSRFHMTFYANQGMYLADCVVEERFREGNVYLMLVRLTTQLKKNQRRQYYRMNCYYRLQFKIFTEEEKEQYEDSKEIPETLHERDFLEGTALDLSGGGVRFVCGEKIKKNDMLLLQMALQMEAGVKTFDIPSVVVAANSTKRDPDLYEIRLCYIDIPERNREVIIKYIFNEERKKRQAGS